MTAGNFSSLTGSRRRIAVVGSGISGLTAAYLLNRQHEVTVFEANDYLGGHTHTVPVTLDGEQHWVDTGFIVCNNRNYPHFLRLLDKLGVAVQKTEMSFSVRNDSQNLEYNGHNLNTLFAQRRNLLRPGFHRFVRDILKFNQAARESVNSHENGRQTLDEFVQELALGNWFRENYLMPMVAAIWSCSVAQAARFPVSQFLRFFLNHGLLDIRNRPQWYVLKGGSHSYLKPLTAPFANRIHLGSAVSSVARTDTGVLLQVQDQRLEFDDVILACHSDQSLRLLAQPTAAETAVLSSLGYQSNRVTLHTDATIMPRRKRAWASWNFLVRPDTSQLMPQVTYNMNILQGIRSSRPLLVTLNADELIHPQSIVQQFDYSHPVYSLASQSAQGRRAEICGNGGIHFCGAYWYNGFHEDGVRSALDVCERFGISL